MAEGQKAELADRIPVFGKIDAFVFRIETLVAVTSLILMSILVFTDVVYQFMVAIEQYQSQGDIKGPVIAGIVAAFLSGMAYASTANMGWEVPKRIGVAVVGVIGLFAFSLGLTRLESSTMYRILALITGVVLFSHLWKANKKAHIGIAVVALIVTFIVCGKLPQGYSWAQSYSLLLLLWVGFLGASMAARQRRHLSVDLARKLLSPKKLPLFNALSYAAAGLFSGIVFYLSFIYMFDAGSTYIRPVWEFPTWLPQGLQEQFQVWPVPENASVVERIARVFLTPGEPGEPPDWLKVLAIPVSFFLITLRFGVHALTFAAMAVRKEEFVEAMEVH